MCRAHNLFRGAITLLCFLFPTLGAPAGWETSNPKDAKAFETGKLSAVKRILTKDNYIERDLSQRTDKPRSDNSTLPSCTGPSVADQPAAVPCTGRAGVVFLSPAFPPEMIQYT